MFGDRRRTNLPEEQTRWVHALCSCLRLQPKPGGFLTRDSGVMLGGIVAGESLLRGSEHALAFAQDLYQQQVQLLGAILDLRDDLNVVKVSASHQNKVADRMLERQRVKEKKIQRLREEKEARELQELQPNGPVMNKKSRGMLRGRDQASLVDRHKYNKEAKKKNQARIKQLLEEQELSAMQASPRINKTSKRLAGARSVGSMMAWEERRQKKIVQAKEAKDARIKSMQKANTPKVSKGSERILRKKKAEAASGKQCQEDTRESVEVASSASARLFEQAEALKRRQEMRVQEAQQQHSFKPSVNRTPSSGRKQPNVVDRLYDWENRRDEKLARAEIRREVEDNVDQETGQTLFQPTINKRSEKIAARRDLFDDDPVEDRLYARGIQYEQKKKKRIAKREAEEDAIKSIPKISLNSEVLASKHRGITRPIGKLKKSTVDSIVVPTFQPNTSPEKSAKKKIARVKNDTRARAPSHDAPIVSKEEMQLYLRQKGKSPQKGFDDRVMDGRYKGARYVEDSAIRSKIFQRMRRPRSQSQTEEIESSPRSPSDDEMERLRQKIFRRRVRREQVPKPGTFSINSLIEGFENEVEVPGRYSLDYFGYE
jgi:hypothetical protein